MNTSMIYDIRDIPKTDDCELGIVVSMHIGQNIQCHCGIAYDMMADTKIIHLATDKKVEVSTDLEGEYFLCYIKPNIHPMLLKSFNEYLKVRGDDIQNGNNNIRYGFLYDEWASIDEQGELHLGQNEVGLTCATYVLTLFHSMSIDLVNINDWPVRESDNEWFEYIINVFRQHGMSKDHISKLIDQKGCPRFHPEEVAMASSLFNGHAAETFEIWTAGAHLWQILYDKAKKRKLERKILRKYGKIVHIP